jgi:flagellar motor component MotA
MTGLLVMLALLDLDRGLARLGSNLAVMLLSVFYALVLNLLFVLPLGAMARRRLLDMHTTEG